MGALDRRTASMTPRVTRVQNLTCVDKPANILSEESTPLIQMSHPDSN